MAHPDDRRLYDSNDYYGADPAARRLTALLDAPLQWLDRRKALFVHRLLGGRAGRVLDVGAGDGKFLKQARDLGHAVRGTTASERSQLAARTQFGVELVLSEDLAGHFEGERFDAITYWHVFEHLRDPVAHARQWSRLLAPGGCLVIEVPNVESLGAQLSRRAWLGSDPVHHINMLTRAGLEALLVEQGMRVESVGQLSAKFTYVYLWSGMLGRLFPHAYDFDSVMDTLRFPARRLRSHPLATLNACSAVAYMLPALAPLAVLAPLTGRGEVLRIVARREPSAQAF